MEDQARKGERCETARFPIEAVRLVRGSVAQINFAFMAKNKIVEIMRSGAWCGVALKQFAIGVKMDQL